MASFCKRRVYSTEKRGFRQDLDSWRSKLIDCVDYKPASVSNWSFDENCLFCCLRREKVKEHVIALNNKIVESGGKPLLGKDHCNINRLEWQVEEFLNAVLHRKEYAPRIPDPHIPVVACDTMQQMINRLLVHYTSNNSQDSPRHNGMDQSLLKTHSSTSPVAVATPTAAASTRNPVLSKLLMEDQDAPLDLSVKKVRPETSEQDGVLDLSIKKNSNPNSMLLRSPPVNLTPPVVRQASDSGFAKASDLHSSSTLEQFMAKLCLHHQRQIVDAFGFLQTEVKAVASSTEVQVFSPTVPEKSLSSDRAEESSEFHGAEETLPVARDKNGSQEPPISKNNEVSPAEQPLKADGLLTASVKNGSSIDLSQTDIGDDVECSSTNIQPKCPTLLIMKNDHENLEAKKLIEVGSIIQQPNTGTLEQGPCASDTPTHTIDHDIGALSSCSVNHGHADPKFLPEHSIDTPVSACSIQRTTNAISTNSSRTAKKSSRGSHSHPRLSPIGNIVNDPDIKYDIVYVGKPITECKLQSQNYMLPRKNARKSTRGHLCFGDCWEIKTVRTLACKPAVNGTGNYPVPMPEITTSITPKQALTKPDGLPPMTVPFTGDCMETVINRNLSDQSVVTEMPGDVVEITSEDLIVEPSQTGQTQQKDQILSLLSDEECDQFVQQDSTVGIHDISDSSEGTPSSTVASETPEKTATKETIDAPACEILDESETEVQGQNVATEALLNPVSSSIESDASEAEGLGGGCDLKNRNATKFDFLIKSPELTTGLRKPVMTCTNNSTSLQMTCGTEANIKAVDSESPAEEKVESRGSDLVVEEISTKEQFEECKGASQSVVAKKGVAKHVLSSDRCLRSGVSKGVSEQAVADVSGQTKLADLQSDIHEKNIPESKQSLSSSKLKHTEENLSCQGGQDTLAITDFIPEKVQHSPLVRQIDSIGNKVCTRQKQKLIMESEKEQKAQELPTQNDELKGQEGVVNNAPENEANMPPEGGEGHGKNSPGKSIRASERMPLRNRSSQIEHSVSSDTCTPTKNISRTPERMPLRNRNSISVDQPVTEDSPTAGPVEKLERMHLRSKNSISVDQPVNEDSPTAGPVEKLERMPLRSKNNVSVDQPATEDSPTAGPVEKLERMPPRSKNNVSVDQPVTEDSPTAGPVEKLERMPLRSKNNVSVDQPVTEDSPTAGPVEKLERMPLRSKNNVSVDQPVTEDSPTAGPVEKIERMPLRSKSNVSVDQPVTEDSPTAGPVEKLERMPLRSRNSCFAEPTCSKDSSISPNTSNLYSVARIPLRSRNSSTASRHVVEGSSDVIKDTSGTITEQPSGDDSGVPSKKLVSTGHMPLRSGCGLMVEQSSSCNSFSSDAGTASESPGRMSLRRSNTFSTEKQDCLPTPPKNKKLSPRLQKMSGTPVLSLVHKDEPNKSDIKTDKLFNDQVKVPSIPVSFTSFNLPTTSPLIPGPCKFLEALNGEANQQLISDLNSKFDKMQKGWVQMDKEGQPAPKPKNKADRLKEIWKSKRRVRKPRSLEQHKFSPVQMLFMKSFDLPNICRWFLQSTETKSLVIVKKVNTRLPSETQLGFQASPSVPESSDGVFPSLQAERLKKHLKKFAIASPVKSNPKNKRLIAKALAQGIAKGKEKQEPRTATRISSKPQRSTGPRQAQSLESRSKVAASAKNPASARILRKYSNMREKKQVQQNSLKNLKSSLVEVDNSRSIMKKVSKEKLSTRRGQKSAIVKKVKRLAKKAKTPATKGKIPKGGRGFREMNEKGGISPKKVLPRVLKSNRVSTPKAMSKKEMLVKTEKSPQAKTDNKKSPLHKSSESLMSQSQIMDMKPLLSEDQVLTRSQRKMEASLAQTGSPKTSTKRGLETSVTLAKRTRTAK
ncbi:uncharacterized protein wu:fc17b08 isoform X2 [Neoarius graeffei]|uniref:uncharacterized protein wu:fc17b08 isoform X2 n=1 Tax=Neoarius graeffei TaxID=443677 RepID=UPI00298BFBAC|nr:uncharacterized protein wu:fc17b08 isoform X2 [Neoarius graeffei]